MDTRVIKFSSWALGAESLSEPTSLPLLFSFASITCRSETAPRVLAPAMETPGPENTFASWLLGNGVPLVGSGSTKKRTIIEPAEIEVILTRDAAELALAG